jgi:hypothetical protein
MKTTKKNEEIDYAAVAETLLDVEYETREQWLAVEEAITLLQEHARGEWVRVPRAEGYKEGVADGFDADKKESDFEYKSQLSALQAKYKRHQDDAAVLAEVGDRYISELTALQAKLSLYDSDLRELDRVTKERDEYKLNYEELFERHQKTEAKYKRLETAARKVCDEWTKPEPSDDAVDAAISCMANALAAEETK